MDYYIDSILRRSLDRLSVDQRNDFGSWLRETIDNRITPTSESLHLLLRGEYSSDTEEFINRINRLCAHNSEVFSENWQIYQLFNLDDRELVKNALIGSYNTNIKLRCFEKFVKRSNVNQVEYDQIVQALAIETLAQDAKLYEYVK